MTNIIHPITLGKLQLPSNLVQAPLAGYTCAPFRVLAHRYGKPGFCCTEMISAKGLISRKDKPKRFLWRDPEEGFTCYQLAASEVDVLARATEMVTDSGADIIDLNCGCPARKIRATGNGSKLLQTPEKIYALVKAMRSATDAVVSIKIRVSGTAGDNSDIAVLQAAESAGIDFITVHGRNWRERYDIPCRLADIAALVAAANVPVFANGDIADYESLQATKEATGCAGFMIGRASVGQPWLFQQLAHRDRGLTPEQPSFSEIGAIFSDHIQQLAKLEGERLAVLESRKLAKYYARGLMYRSRLMEEVQHTTELKPLMRVIAHYF